MFKIFTPSVNDIQDIIELARETWIATYSSTISQAQIDYMLNAFYNPELIEQQLKDTKHHFFALSENETLLGYAHAIELDNSMKLSKLYCLPNQQGKGLGKSLLLEVEKKAKSLNYTLLELCVNRGNPAQFFYEKMGFKIDREEDFPIGDFWMNDYVMMKSLN